MSKYDLDEPTKAYCDMLVAIVNRCAVRLASIMPAYWQNLVVTRAQTELSLDEKQMDFVRYLIETSKPSLIVTLPDTFGKLGKQFGLKAAKMEETLEALDGAGIICMGPVWRDETYALSFIVPVEAPLKLTTHTGPALAQRIEQTVGPTLARLGLTEEHEFQRQARILCRLENERYMEPLSEAEVEALADRIGSAVYRGHTYEVRPRPQHPRAKRKGGWQPATNFSAPRGYSKTYH